MFIREYLLQKSRKILLLQGPMSSYFQKLAEHLERNDHQTFKINFNAGDIFFYRKDSSLNYHGGLENWEEFLQKFIEEKNIDTIFLFGSKRPYHLKASFLAKKLRISVFCFDEGILRPDYISIEPLDFRLSQKNIEKIKVCSLEKKRQSFQPFSAMAWGATFYALAITFFPYKNSLHHRNLNALVEAYRWLKSFWKKKCHFYYSKLDIDVTSTPYFLLILQVHNDYQVRNYRFKSVKASIIETMRSFSKEAQPNQHLIIKHHPLDIAYKDYRYFINHLMRRYNLQGRVHYILDGYLPQLLKNTQGTICINSTVGLSALQKNIPVKLLGRAQYDLPGLTHQGPLKNFWHEPGFVNQQLCQKLCFYYQVTTQFNTSFYQGSSVIFQDTENHSTSPLIRDMTN